MFQEQVRLSPTVKIHWLGFDSTLERLQREGWKVALDFEPYRYCYQFALRHQELNLTALLEKEYLEFSRYSNPYEEYPITMGVRYYGRDININYLEHTMYGREPFQFKPVDARSCLAPMDDVTMMMGRPCLFRISEAFDVKPIEKEVIIEKVIERDLTISEHLNKVLELQEPKLKDIRVKKRKREAKEPAISSNVVQLFG